jgi:hypothetical protein
MLDSPALSRSLQRYRLACSAALRITAASLGRATA